jgi:hypothetical protein
MQRGREAARGVRREALQEGKGEAGGLAGARLRGAEKVAAGEDEGNGLCLDRRGFRVTLLRDGAQQLGR